MLCLVYRQYLFICSSIYPFIDLFSYLSIYMAAFPNLSVLKTIFYFCLAPPPPGGPGGGSGLSFSLEDRGFWADSGPDPGGNIFLLLIFALSAARKMGAYAQGSAYPPPRPFPRTPPTSTQSRPSTEKQIKNKNFSSRIPLQAAQLTRDCQRPQKTKTK